MTHFRSIFRTGTPALILLATLTLVGIAHASDFDSTPTETGGTLAGIYAASVYQGVAVVTTATTIDNGGDQCAAHACADGSYCSVNATHSTECGLKLLELGNNGSDIASSGHLYFRPQSLAEGSAVRLIVKNGKTNLYAPGGVCLNNTCLDAWPSGTGTDTWDLLGATYLTPHDSGAILEMKQIADSAISPSLLPELEVYGNAPSALTARNTDLGAASPAGDFSGNLSISHDLLVVAAPATGSEAVVTNGTITHRLWHPGNDGAGSGLDAGSLDGTRLRIENSTTCGGGDGVNTQSCLCADVGVFPSSWKCFQLPL